MRSFVEQYTTIDKSGWGDGLWSDEPDKVVWVDQATDLDCMAQRNPHMGNWCGYVGVPEGHLAFGQFYDDVHADVHGGLTFAGGCEEGSMPEHGICHVPQPGRAASVWWLGFDCAHFMDLMPALAAREKEMGFEFTHADLSTVYWPLDAVVTECESLAAQLVDYGTPRLASGRVQDATARHETPRDPL